MTSGPLPCVVAGRVPALAYGVASYLAFLAAFLYAVGFVGDLVVPKTIDSGLRDPSPVAAALADTLLHVRRTAQHHGPTGIQAVVDAIRPALRRAEHVRPGQQPPPRAPLLAMAANLVRGLACRPR